MDKRTASVAASGSLAALVLGLVGCSGHGGSSLVNGNRDDVKHKAAVRHLATRPTYRTDCSSISGVAYVVNKPIPPRPAAPKINKAPSVPKAPKFNKAPVTPKVPKHAAPPVNPNCHKVKTGTETYWQQVSAERWCVELDNVNNDKSADDRWFTVTQSTYLKWAAKHEGDRVVKMRYLHKGC